MENSNISIRKWLVKNNYEDVEQLINSIMLDWKLQGKHTRRNWWDILAGGKNGKPYSINGITFPVLKAAQERKGLPITHNAICRNPNEVAPRPKQTGRWNES